ncbi:DUF5801 repeats-in-toxin domain-containing protein [Pseudomonas helvetica]|uniref:DUF5801 repeats-in-toxin domain-containing protein n=1 Tax=Pseudomonas helvetica TaxID=3136738 RepID=UPI003265ABC9
MANREHPSSPTSDTDPQYTPIVTSDLKDYAPGSTATVTASGFAPGSTVEFQVEHATGPGADNVWGTPDDVLDTDTGEGHDPWYVTDGGVGDLDGKVNGSITTSWYVNPDDSAGATFLLTATSAGADGVFGTSDDSVATTSFTDSSLSVVATGVNVTQDETAGLQNSTATPSPAEDANDNDILVTALPSTFSTRLTALGAGAPMGAALSGYTGAAGDTGSNAFTITAAPGAIITDISFVDSSGAALNGLDSGLSTLDGTSILLYTDTNNNIVLGRAGGPTGAIVFAAYIEESGSPVTGGKIWTVEFQPLKHPDITNPDDSVNLLNKVFIGASQDSNFSLDGAPSGQQLFLMFTTPGATADANGRIPGVSIVVTGKDPLDQSASSAAITSADTVNSSQGGGSTTLGTNNQAITEQEGLRFSFVSGAKADFTIPNLSPGEAGVEANIDFNQYFGARSATFKIVQETGGTTAKILLAAFKNADNVNGSQSGVNFINSYADDSSEKVAITNGSVTVKTFAGVTISSAVITYNADGTVLVTGVPTDSQITYGTSTDHNRVLIENAGLLTDKNGDKTHADFDIGGFQVLQSSAATAEIGSKIAFEDDGPSISTTGTEPTLTVDESNLAINATQNFAANFSSAYGADGAGTLTYALGVVAGASGLTDTATGEAVNLSLNGTVVEGRTATTNLLVFTVSVAANGDVTLDQLRAIVHPDTTNPDDSKSLSSDNLVTLTATKTDGDGDSAHATLNIGQNLVFKDDGPSISTTGTEPTLTVDETNLAINATQNFAANFNSAYGADGAGTLTYALGVVAGGSGLTDTATGEAVNLSLNGTVVEGRTATTNLLVFTVSVAANGDVTLDQLRAIVHPDTTNPDDSKSLSSDNLVTLTATTTDKDGDSAHATLNIGQNLVFKDDGPSISTTGTEPTLTVDETNLAINATQNFAANFSSAYGADGAGTLTYALGVVAGGSGLTDTATGEAVNLSLNGTVVEGRTATTNLLVFTVSVAANGDVTLDQIRALIHPDATNPDDSITLSSDNLVTLTATKTDKDGDSAHATLNIGQNLVFHDDGPSLAYGNLVGTGSTLAQYGFWDHSTGADGLGATGLDISLVNGQFTLVRPDHTTTTGTGTLTEQASSPDANGAFHFAGTLTGDFDNNAATPNTSVDYTLTAFANGTYALDLVQGFSSTIVLSSADGSLSAGGPDPVRTLVIPTTNPSGSEDVVFFSAKALASTSDILTGIGLGAPDPTEAQLQTNPLPSYIDPAAMNVSTSGIGVGNNLLQGDNLVAIGAADESFVINPQTLLTGMKVFIDNSVGGYDPATEDLYYRIYYEDGTFSNLTKVNTLTPEAGGEVSFLVEKQGSSLIDAVQLTMGRGAVKIPVIQFIQQTDNLASDVKLSFNAKLTDKDGDSATSTFNANLFANDPHNATFDYTLVGTTGVNDAFNVDLAATENKYQITGFDVNPGQRDTLVLNGDHNATVQSIDNTGANSVVTVAESGGQITTITLVGIDLQASDIVFGA